MLFYLMPPGVLLSKSSVIGSILGTISSSIATRIEGNRPITNKEVKKIFEIKDICKVYSESLISAMEFKDKKERNL